MPTLAVKPREMSPEVRNRDISGPKNGHVSTKNLKQQVSIPVGCVPPACRPYLGGRRVCIQVGEGGLHPGGLGRLPTPCEQTDRYKNIICPKLHFRVVTRMHSSRICTTCFSGCPGGALLGVCWLSGGGTAGGVCLRHPLSPGETPTMSRHTPPWADTHHPGRHHPGQIPPGRHPLGRHPFPHCMLVYSPPPPCRQKE